MATYLVALIMYCLIAHGLPRRYRSSQRPNFNVIANEVKQSNALIKYSTLFIRVLKPANTLQFAYVRKLSK
jgi:hypothetical protein